uniref:Uncharacterized protein n=1 Tax=Aegithalos caudatus parvoviridae sp. TaxID=2794464 RepID=A0A8A4XDW4_9VIRU|nr:MAG: hypothetical protein [Aegithalos caudatus parvoviridae sp.]
MARNITFEPCTLVYTLLDNCELNFDDFSLIVRSLHSYMVDTIVPNPVMNNVHVKLNYQASLSNAIAKLGTLQSIVAVTKLSSFVKESEFSHLEQLRRRFGIGSGDTSDSPPVQACKARKAPKKSYSRGTPRVFNQRPAPYAVPQDTQQELGYYQENDSIILDPESS